MNHTPPLGAIDHLKLIVTAREEWRDQPRNISTTSSSTAAHAYARCSVVPWQWVCHIWGGSRVNVMTHDEWRM
jgi:hypothetical protein